jgi:hypothetical protein
VKSGIEDRLKELHGERIEQSEEGFILQEKDKLKKTVGQHEWQKILHQFTGAFLRSDMIASFLHIPICDIHVYTACREIKTSSANSTILLRNANSNKEIRDSMTGWEKSDIDICCFGARISCKNHRIVLDQNGNGCMEVR